METQSPIQLQKPGAGLPFFENLIAKYFMVPQQTRRTTWEQNRERFLKEGDRILSITTPLKPEQMETRILIDRFPGIEDSSRFWSVAMTLEHLMIVGTGMGKIITELSQNRVPLIEVNTAAVKPKNGLKAHEANQKFKDFVRTLSEKIQTETGDPRSQARLAHPWFGKLNAHQWNWLLGRHQAVHRRQIVEILSHLPKSSTY